MAKRKKMKQNSINEGYHALGKKTSYNDSVPTVKIILQHSKVMEDGEKRFRHIEKIYLENTDGERILAPTCRPGVAKIYARLLAEGDKPYGDRWDQVGKLVEDYTKLSGFLKATKNRVFNESAQKLIENTVSHYASLQETLNKLMTHRGYNNYFDNWSPVLNEGDDSAYTVDLSEMFHNTELDHRIESALPIIQQINRGLTESSEDKYVAEIEQWSQGLIDEAVFGEEVPRGEKKWFIYVTICRQISKIEIYYFKFDKIFK
jgi:hypothetical protein